MKKTLAILIILSLLLSACGASTAPMEDMKNESSTVSGSGLYDSAETPAESPEAAQSLQENRKLIRTVRMDAETEDLDTLLYELDLRITSLGGYIQSRTVQGTSGSDARRYRAELTVRIPAMRLEEFVNHVTQGSNILSQTEEAQDITLSYTATESRVEALETEHERLLELLAQAESMEDLLLIESRLTEVRAELEQVTRQLMLYANQVDYATVHLSISQVREYTPVAEKTLWQKLVTSLSDSWEALGGFAEGVLIALVALLPWLIPIALAAGITVLAVKLAYRKKKKA